MIKLGLLGEKLSHSLSPFIHNKIFEHNNIAASYELFEVAKSDIFDFKKFMIENDIVGVNITIPYKTYFIDKLDYISEHAQKISAINVMYQKDGKFYGDNTDYYGFLESLKKYNIDVRNKNVSIIGNGGACRAVETVLNDLNANVTKYYRAHKKSSIDFYKNDSCPCGELLVNTTPLGMYPNISDSPAPKDIIKNFKSLLDLVYNPSETKFMQLAKDLNIPAYNGLDMLVYQAIKADEIFFNKKLKVDTYDFVKEQLIKFLKDSD